MAIRVALVDDEPSVRTALARVLRHAGYEVGTYASGDEFLAGLDQFRPDCVVLDVHMPGLTGLQVQLQLRARDLRLPAVFITASDGVHIESSILDAGGHCLLRKPCASKDLLASLQSAMRP